MSSASSVSLPASAPSALHVVASSPPPSCYTRSTYNPPNFNQNGSFTSDRPAIKGRNVSGRSWKTRPQKRTSSLVTKVKTNNLVKGSWEEKRLAQERRKEVKLREKEMREATRSQKLEKKARREEQEKRRAENQFKALQTQELNLTTVGSKMKAMSKKQLRMIKKTRMNNKTGVVELVSPYAK
mmetsp:Transcript_16541/g.33702  ORF Transcript_16541/g.33702 Transcript_16541/m.33702 type:complete len:183 (-) Transcript_16541:79-627(-)